MMNARRVAPTAILVLQLCATSLAAQSLRVASNTPTDTTVATQTDSTPAPPPAPRFLGVKFSGYVETAFNRSNRPNGAVIADRVFEQASNHVTLNAVKLTLDRAADPAKLDVGLHADAVFGENARFLQVPGYTLGRKGDLYQLYATLNLPTPDGNGVQVKAGRMSTSLGFEVIETPVNPNATLGNAFYFAENFTQTGVSVEHRFNRVVDAQFRVLNGWDQIKDVNGRFSYMARVGFAPDEATLIALVGFAGPEQAGNNSAMRSGLELLTSRRIGKVTAALQGDVGKEQRNDALPDPNRDATWWAAGSWLLIDATPKLSVAFRGDYLSDRTSSRTAGAFGIVGAPDHRLASATATLNVKLIPRVLLRPELRYDRSNQSDFATRSNQFTFGLSAAYQF